MQTPESQGLTQEKFISLVYTSVPTVDLVLGDSEIVYVKCRGEHLIQSKPLINIAFVIVRLKDLKIHKGAPYIDLGFV